MANPAVGSSDAAKCQNAGIDSGTQHQPTAGVLELLRGVAEVVVVGADWLTGGYWRSGPSVLAADVYGGGVCNLQAMMLMLTIFVLFTMFIDVHTPKGVGVNIIYKQHPVVMFMDVYSPPAINIYR